MSSVRPFQPHPPSSKWRKAAWSLVTFFIPPRYKTVTQYNVDDHVGCVGLILICFLMATPTLISCFQIFFSPYPIPKVTFFVTLIHALHLIAFPFLLKITGRRNFLSNYLAIMLFCGGLVNCAASGGGFWVFNCTPFPVLPLIATFLDNRQGTTIRCFIWTGLLGTTCVALYIIFPEEYFDMPMGEVRKFTLAGNMFNLFVLAILGSLFCLTRDLKQREIELQRDKATTLSKVKTEFSANVSHEIRTPLVAIMGLGELLASDNSLSKDQQYFVKTIHSASQDLLSLVNNILTFVKTESLDATGLQLERTRIHILDLIDETVRFLCTAKSNRVSLLTFVDDTIDSSNCYVEGDPHRIRQILQNLLANAIKFCPQDGTGEVCISIRLQEATKRFEFCVADNGIGINEKNIPKLFQPFQQADASTTRKYGGSGLGLVICKQVCELMGGSIWLTSKEGQGTHVTFTLPLPILSPSPEEFSRIFTNINGLRVGMVTKSRLLDRIVGNYVSSLGALDFNVLPANQIHSTTCDIVIIDIPSAPDLVQFASFSKFVRGVIFLGSFRLKTPTLLWHQQNRTVPAVRFCLSDPVSKFSLAKAFGSIMGKQELLPKFHVVRTISQIVEHTTESELALTYQTVPRSLELKSPVDVAFYDAPTEAQKRKYEECTGSRKKPRLDPLTIPNFPTPTPAIPSPKISGHLSLDTLMEDPNDLKIRILVAEDNIVNQEVINRQLGRMGFAPDIVGNGRLALEAYKLQRYDLILMDCQMPEMDGYESASAIRIWESDQRIFPPADIVALSASAMPEEIERGMRSGMDDYLAKPIKLSKLKEVVQGVVNKKNIHR